MDQVMDKVVQMTENERKAMEEDPFLEPDSRTEQAITEVVRDVIDRVTGRSPNDSNPEDSK